MTRSKQGQRQRGVETGAFRDGGMSSFLSFVLDCIGNVSLNDVFDVSFIFM